MLSRNQVNSRLSAINNVLTSLAVAIDSKKHYFVKFYSQITTHSNLGFRRKILDYNAVLGIFDNITGGNLRSDINSERISICKNEWRDSGITYTHEQGVIFVNQTPNPEIRRLLYILGVSIGLALLLTAIIYLLLGIGVLSAIPTYVIWAIVLFSIGAGILSGVGGRR